MNNIISQFAHIFIHYYSNKAFSTCKLFISEPTKNQEAQMGRLFGIFEINTPSRENSQILTQLISDLEEIYYSQINDEQADIENILEKTLAEINLKFTQLIKEKKFYLVGNLNEYTIKEKINFAIGVLKDEKLYLSYLNNVALFLIHKTKQDYKLIDIKKIAQEVKDNQVQEKNAKLFSNLINGEIKAQDYLFLCNSSFLEFITLERIQKIITSLPLHKAAEYFKNSLLQFEGHNFAAIMIKNFSIEDAEATPSPSSLVSITELNITETSTERLLEPSFWSNLKALPLYLKHFFTKKEKPSLPALEKTTSPVQTKSPTILKPIISLGKYLNTKFKKAGQGLLAKTPYLNDKINNLKVFLRLKIAYFGTNLKKIPNLSKILLIIAILLVILFVYSTSYFKNQQIKNEHDQEFQKIATQIEEKKNQADSDLIYGNEDKARSEIAEAQQLLANLMVESQKQKDRQTELNKGIEEIVAKLRHITTVSEPILIADLSAQQAENINVLNLLYQNNQLLAFDSINNLGYQINLDTREIKKITCNLSDLGQIVKAKKIDDKILIYQAKNSFIQFTGTGFLSFPVSLPVSAKIADFASYNGRLYTLDLNTNQIYRQPKAETGYGDGVNWLRDSMDLKNIVSLGIDTNIWLLDSTGQILKFNKGRKQNFSPKDLEPALEAPAQLITNDETNYLYILESKNKRIVVLDKEGNLITQYFNPSFDNLKAFELVEKEKKMFVINDNKIYFFNLTHIK